MAKFDYVDTGNFYIGEDEKKGLVKDGAALPVLSVESRVSQFKDDDGNPQNEFLITVEVDGEERGLTFTQNRVDSRDRYLFALQAFLEREDAEPVSVTISRKGRAYLVATAE